MDLLDAQRFDGREDNSAATDMARQRHIQRGVMRLRRVHKGRPSNLGDPRLSVRNSGCYGEPVTNPCGASSKLADSAMTQPCHEAPHPKMVRTTVDRRQGKTGVEVDEGAEVGGPNTSEDAGEGLAADPAEQRRPVSAGTSGEKHDRRNDDGLSCQRNF
jgi:hypothetical protein